MISLLYHSHTVVPAHLAELEGLSLVEPDEQILVALDGVLLDGAGRRLSGPTLHDYCLITSLRVVLWARDYGRHLCFAFPLAELAALDGVGVDPLHAAVELTFAAPEGDGPEERFTLTLLPLADLQAALTLLRAAGEAARSMHDQGVDPREAGPEVFATLSALVYGSAEGPRPGELPYRWPDAPGHPAPLAPSAAFQQDPASLPPGQIYAAGRLARSAWDTLRKTLKEADLPFDLSSGSLRELTEAVRAVNDLVHTVSSNPAAQQMAMAFINRQGGQAPAAAPAAAPTAAPAPEGAPAVWAAPAEPAAAPQAPAPSAYHEIPLRRRGAPAPSPLTPADPRPAPPPPTPVALRPEPAPDRREIPLRRRVAAHAAAAKLAQQPRSAAFSGSGDAGDDDRR
jgi:hypothetical protein